MAIVSTLIKSFDWFTTIATLFILLTSYVFYTTHFYPTYISPLRHIPGPPNKSKYNKRNIPFLGLFFDIIRNEAGVTFREWTEQYGSILCYNSLFNKLTVHIADPEAIHHVFGTHAYKYPKPDRVIRLMGSIIGMGLLLVEGDIHRKQRKMFSPAFSHKTVKEMVPNMSGPAQYLAKIWESRIDETESDDKTIEMNVVPELSACTLDIIGLVGFGFDFEGLTRPGNEVVKAFDEIFSSKTATILQFFRHYVPYYSKLPFKHNLDRMQSVQAIDRVSCQIISEKRAQAVAASAKGYGEVDEKKDLISIMMRANEASEDRTLTDEDLKVQIKTFIAAGHETTSSAVTWMLHIFATHPDVQSKVRQEFLTHIGRPASSSSTSSISYDAINALPYLNCCIKELFRVIPPIHTTTRVATEDDVLLGYLIPKGTEIYLSPAALHKLKHVWGDDAEEFKPERWMSPSALTEEQRQTTKCVTPDMTWAYMPFLTGPRNCIGSKVALMKIKIMLYYLLVNLEYQPVPGFKFRKSARITLRPSPGMNLIVKRFQHVDKSDSKPLSP